MAQAAWEKSSLSAGRSVRSTSARSRWQYLVGAGLIMAAVVYLILTGTLSGARFFITVNELLGDPQYVGQTVRITGAVIGDTIVYDPERLLIEFSVAHIPQENQDLAVALHVAANDPTVQRLAVRVENQVRPELLQHEAQAIMTGYLGEDGIFHVSELNLKCPSRFMENMPDPAIGRTDA
jgi:cytochrome c-type biogenesis protein CcmE